MGIGRSPLKRNHGPAQPLQRHMRFFNLTGHYRKFPPDFADRTAVLTDLTRKDSPNRIKWNNTCNMTLKSKLCSRPILKSPDFEREFILKTDASDWGVGAVLSQQDNGGIEHPIAYFSHKLLP